MTESVRRGQILDAVDDLLSSGGLGAVTMRSVAARAGVSLRLVQYYGRSKEELLLAALDRLSARSFDRWRARADEQDDPETALAAFLYEALPDDDRSRALHRVGVSLELLALTEQSAVGDSYVAHLRRVTDHLATLWRRVDTTMDVAEAERSARESAALIHGLGSLVMAGHSDASQARDVVERHVGGAAPRAPEPC